VTAAGKRLRRSSGLVGLPGVMTEDALHCACVQFLRLYEARGLLTFTHPANGAHKNPATAGLMKALGQQAGVSDLLVWAVGAVGARHFAVEIKTDRGRLSAAQAAWMDRMTHMGFRVHVCRSLEGLQAILAEGLPLIGTLSAANVGPAIGVPAARGRTP
jgi:VRR-NUC domain